MNENENYDVVVVGGGAAGLSGAVALARSRRSVLVVDAGDPRNAPAGHVHNFLSRDGTPPSELYAAGRAEVTGYGGRVETGRVAALARDGERFGVQISAHTGERTVVARRLLVATGLRDVLAGRGHLALDAVVVAPRMEARAELLEPLGLKPAEVLIGEHPLGTRIEADRTGATAVPGVWVAGNLTDPQAQVVGAAAAGLMAGAAINFDLILDEARSRG